MKKGMIISIIVILALSAMIVRINDRGYLPFNTEQHLAYTAYTDNLNEKEKADIGLMGISSLTNLVNTVNTTFEYAKKVVLKVTKFLDKANFVESVKKWWNLPITVPIIGPIFGG